ncbi:TauD/TfdA family dioxygenase [Streptomyces sp. Je 1-79]|uniref:TauD/TfdA family dioxygenase n=1 Tax=Streptomyces sp. Je 1-79 TaxID=2943847 RepID=UPI0027E4DFA6|nr:TauD/TfdA family dioxygenase [Streptomyces sp. Je 1-79]
MSSALFHKPHTPEPTVLYEIPGPSDAVARAGSHKEELLGLVAAHGAVLVRGLGLRDTTDVEAVVRQLTDRPVREAEGFAPREVHAEGIYSSAVWPANQPMCMHHELSYARRVPGLLLFACLEPPADGGATATADAAAVLEALPAALVDRFEDEGWLLERSYNGDVGATLSQSFGTEDRETIDAYCRVNDIEATWRSDGALHTRQRRSAVIRHPAGGRRCWFNQIAFLSEWTLDPEVRDFLIEEYGPDGLPFTTRYGDGDPVPQETVEQINKTYDHATVRRPWQAGDLLLVDNLRTAHSREAYTGPRQVLVAMADPVRPPLPDRQSRRAEA